MLNAVSDHLRTRSIRRFVGVRSVEHREFAARRIRAWRPYEDMERGVIPPDALMIRGGIGIPSYYVPDLAVLDQFGLTDAAVARNPVTTPNRLRYMAHDRRPSAGYLEERGVNFHVYPPTFGEIPGAFGAQYSVKVGHDLWMPFDTADFQWTVERFAGRELRIYAHPTDPQANLLSHDSRLWIGDRFLQHFEDGFGGWRIEGEAVTNHGQHGPYANQPPILGNAGPGFLTSFHPTLGDRATGRAFSPEFTAQDGRLLSFRIAGGKGDGVGMRLLADGEPVAVWRGWNTEHLKQIVHPLAGITGKRLRLELFDHETGGWGHIMLDHVLIFREMRR